MNIAMHNCLILTVLFILYISNAQGRTVYPVGGCDPHKLTVYRVYLQTAWSREVYPKQYPEWRPPAQWSKLIGRSHDRSYELFHMNEIASEGIKQFAEVGSTDVLEDESQGEGGIFDEFNAPAIAEGVGEVEAEFFVDGNHSLVSLASRVVPSPDWFIGIDSFDLCVEGKWIESVMLEVDPLDAGTDNGFTFTSPNWPTVPKKPISRITAQNPNHPANSFFYPDRLEHPPIATIHIMKVKEYELSRVFDPSAPRPGTSHKIYTNAVTDVGGLSRKNDKGYEVSNEVVALGGEAAPSDPSEHVIITDLVKKYKKKFKKNRTGRKMATRRQRKPRDCRVSEWGEWADCSKSCGIGEQVRERKVLKHSRRGGRPCPILKEQKWCGSSRDCVHKYFDW